MPFSLALAAGGALLGAIIGSYLATIILRWPRGEGAARGRSACDACGKPLGAAELVPIASYVIRRGRCAACAAPIDPLHLHVEMAAALIGMSALVLLPGVSGLVLALMGWILLPLIVLDWRHLWLPDRLTFVLGASGLLLGGLANGVPLIERAVGGIAGFAALWAIALLYRRLRGREGMGEGDPKLLGALGCWTGWAGLPPLLLVSAAGLLAFLLISGRAGNEQSQHPFGSALGVAGFLVVAVQARMVMLA